MASSFTIWYKKRDGEESKPSLELHINLWVYDKKDNSIDFGLKISNPQVIKELYMYVPFIVKDKDLINLTEVIAKDKETSDLLFNTNVSLKDSTGEIVKTEIDSKRLDY